MKEANKHYTPPPVDANQPTSPPPSTPHPRPPAAPTAALYVHIPFCTAKCPYCAFYSVPLADHDLDRFLAALLAELDTALKQPHAFAHPFQTVYIGGGSPSCLPQHHLTELVRQLTRRTGQPTEFTIEVNPAQITPRQLDTLRQLGVNRLSIGAQSFNQADLDFLARPYSPEHVRRLVAHAHAAGFDNISLDLIFAIPHATRASWRRCLDNALQLNVQHLSAYALTYEKNTPLYAQRQAGQCTPIDEETDRAMYETAIDTLQNAGFRHYEISNFARPHFPCRHNLTYWNNDPYLGIGPAAASCHQHRRFTNLADVNAYLSTIENHRSPAAQTQIHTPDPLAYACETAVLMLRRTAGIPLADFQRRTGYDPLSLFAQPIAQHTAAHLLDLSSTHLRLTRTAYPVADHVLCDFAAL